MKKILFDKIDCDEKIQYTETLKLIEKLFGKDFTLDNIRNYPILFDGNKKMFAVKIMEKSKRIKRKRNLDNNK